MTTVKAILICMLLSFNSMITSAFAVPFFGDVEDVKVETTAFNEGSTSMLHLTLTCNKPFVSLIILDEFGSQVDGFSIDLLIGKNNLNFDVSNFTTGNYFVSFTNVDKNEYHEFSIKSEDVKY